MKDLKMKTMFFGLLLMVSLKLIAQDNPKSYEYVIVSTWPFLGKDQINIAYDNGTTETISIDKNVIKTGAEVHPYVLRQISKMQEKGWGLMSTTASGTTLYFMLRKQKTN